MSVPVAILAGGLASRLGGLAQLLPKSLIEVAGRPFVEHQLLALRAQGYRDIVLCVAHLGESIESAIGDGHRFGMNIGYSHDGEALLGTGGALRRALPRLGDAFLVQYGDSYLTFDFRAVEAALQGNDAAMAVLLNEGQWDRSNVLMRDGRLALYSKTARDAAMRHIDAGLLAFRREAFEGAPDGAFDLAEWLSVLSRQGRIAAVEVQERFHEIGSLSGLEETRAFLAFTEAGP